MIELDRVEYDINAIKHNHGIEPFGPVQKYIDSEVLRLCDPLVPKDTGELINSGIRSTRIGSGEVKYNTVYARRWYYMNTTFAGASVHFNEAPQRGSYWFERMKQQYLNQILDGAAREARAH